MIEAVKKIFNQYIREDNNIVVAVSGGKDSMCLLSILIASNVISRDKISVLNIDHGIRGQSSIQDSAFVKEFCTQNDISFIGRKLDIPSLCKISKKSTETEARDQRRQIYQELLREGRADKVLLAHHMDDQVETVLMHIFRGAGLHGLEGMKVFENGILRPLLSISRAQIEEYIVHNSIPFVEDESNNQNDFDRNFLRNEIIPRIRQRWNGVDSAIAKLSNAALQNNVYLDKLIDQSLISKDELSSGIIKLDNKCFLSDALAVHYIFAALKELQINTGIDSVHISAIKQLANGRNGARIELSAKLYVIKEYSQITFCKREIPFHKSQTDNKREIPPQESKVEKKGIIMQNGRPNQNLQPKHSTQSQQDPQSFGVGEFVFGNKEIKAIPIDIASVNLGQELEESLLERTLYFDLDKLPKDAILRQRREGDIFRPFGSGSKKLKEYLIDKRIPARLRNQIPCVCVQNQILVLAGIEISDLLRIDGSTKNPAKLQTKTLF